jgi:VWFA-related protein
MHQIDEIRHPNGGHIFTGKDSATMGMGRRDKGRREWKATPGFAVLTLIFTFCLATPVMEAQSGGSQSQAPAAQSPAAQQDQNIPDAPSTVQPPPKIDPDEADSSSNHPQPNQNGDRGAPGQAPANESTPPPPMPPVQTLPPGTPIPGAEPRNQVDPTQGLYTLRVNANFVQVPVTVKNSDGGPVYGLTPKDFTVKENGKIQTLSFFTSDPYPLSVAILLDVGMPDVDLQRVHETYSALVGAFSAYDEVALYTYSSIVSQVTDFTRHSERLTAALNEIKLDRGGNGGQYWGGPLATGPTVNGMPAGGDVPPINTPPKEYHVLNDAILRAALDLGKRDRGKDRRKVIFVITDGREFGSQASYRDVLKVLQTRDITVKGVVVDVGTLPGIRQIEKFHLKGQGYSDLIPKYSAATGGGQIFGELTRNAMEAAYVQIASEARNQYTLGYVPQATTGSSAYRSVEVIVHRKGLKVIAKDGYYAVPTAR